MPSHYDLRPEFIATYEEVCELARFWLDQLYNLDVFWLTTGWTGGSENRRHMYARRRVAQIEKIIGEEQLQQVNEQVAEKYRQMVGDRVWRILTSGNMEEVERLQDEMFVGFEDES